LVAMLGIGIAEQSGLINAVIRMMVLNSHRRLLTFVIVLPVYYRMLHRMLDMFC